MRSHSSCTQTVTGRFHYIWHRDRDTSTRNLPAFFKCGADVTVHGLEGWTPLHWALDGSDVELVRIVLEGGVDPNARGKHGCAPLRWASLRAPYGLIHILLDGGAHPRLQDAFGWTPLHYASGS